MTADPRLAAFASADVPEIFHAVAHQHEIWLPDPFDVPEIHTGAREVFARLLQQASTPPGQPYGRIVLLRGEAGSGKTHLMRAFRNYVHSNRRGYFAYLQMTTSTSDYGRYVLQKVIDSLQKPYAQPELETSGLRLVSDALVSDAPPGLLAAVREDDRTGRDLAQAVFALSEYIMALERFHDADANTLRALVYLQSESPIVKNRVLQYLRCDALTEFDREAIACIAPRPDGYEPLRVVADLGRIVWAAQRSPLVVCVDQIEDVLSLDQAKDRLPRVMSTMTSLGDEIPSSVIVVSCLDDLYEHVRGFLTQSTIDRLERDPEPVRLTSSRSRAEIDRLVAYRLRYLYETKGVAFDESQPTYPIPPEKLDELVNLPTRKVLEYCLQYRASLRKCRADDTSATHVPRAPVAETSFVQMSQEWNDFLAEYARPTPDTEEEQAALVAWAVDACADDIGAHDVLTARANEGFVEVDFNSPAGGHGLLIGICNAPSRGGALSRQVARLAELAHDRCPVVVRSTEFPRNPRTKIARQIGRLVANGGCRVVIEDADWRAIQAMQAFRVNYQMRPSFPYWLRDEQPMARLPSLRAILSLDDIAPRADDEDDERPAEAEAAPDAAPQEPARAKPGSLTTMLSNVPVRIGRTAGAEKTSVILGTDELKQGMALVGGAGCGKSTAALAIVESLVIRGSSAIVVDATGDLAAYAKQKRWDAPEDDASRLASREALRQRADIVLYTPGLASGRNLVPPVVPRGLSEMSVFDREQAASAAAAAFGGALGYGRSARDANCLAVLKKAIEILGTAADIDEPRIEDLVGLVDQKDPSLMGALGRLDEKVLEKVVQDLEGFRIARPALFGAGGERISAERLLGLGDASRPGKTRLSIISTRFLGDPRDTRYWMTHLLLEMSRWAASNPHDRLRALFLLEHAEVYLPAGRQPSTKPPLEGLLKRSAAAGLGVLITTNSPTEIDYACRDNIRTWLVGRVVQETSLKKLAPLFADAHADPSNVPGQEAGEFVLLAAGMAVKVRAERSLLAPERLGDDEITKLAAR